MSHTFQGESSKSMPPASSTVESSGRPASIHWFRHGLRLHDNPALIEALEFGGDFYPIFIFDGEVAGIFYFFFLSLKKIQLLVDRSMYMQQSKLIRLSPTHVHV
jgi:hypothetical protein